ncbi:MAG: TadE family protein [Bryobacteraceae bacterium]|jgi:Flp pilus assembly protein TadG
MANRAIPANSKGRIRRSAGQAVVEVTMLIPWMVFAFVAAFNFGVFAYSMISTENAARTGAMYAAQSLTVAQGGSIVSQVCPYVLGELGDAPGVGSGVTTCTGSPVSVTVTANTPGSGGMNTVKVSVTYNTMQMIPLPGLMAGSLAITRSVELPIRN